jgi:hypothetical protein
MLQLIVKTERRAIMRVDHAPAGKMGKSNVSQGDPDYAKS